MIDITKQQANSFWAICSKYLTQKTDMRVVKELVSESTDLKLTSLSKIYVSLLKSISNRQGMPKAIGNVSRLSLVLFDFSPVNIYKQYGLDWKMLFNEIKNKIKPKSRMNKNVPQNYWVVFTKGALDGAAFLTKFKSGKHFAEIGRKGQEVLRKRYPGMASEWGKKGGRPRKNNI